MKSTVLPFLLLIISSSLVAQEFNQISMGEDYSKQAFYDLNTGNSTEVEMDAWDIAFNMGAFSVGIVVNEGSSSTTENPQPEFKVFLTASTDFSAVDTSIMIQIYNDEVSWNTGAFNTVADTSNPFDFGWGVYNPSNHKVTGNRIFVVQLRDETFKKLKIDSFVAGTFYYKYSNLDGSELQTHSVIKSDYQGQSFAYFSFKENAFVDIAPQVWDLLFTRYTRLLDAGGGVFIQYMLTGVLSAPGVEVVQADNVDVEKVKYEDFEYLLSDTLDVIGYDWKQFNFNTYQYQVVPSRAYFVKTSDNEVYKVVFIDFEGSSTGTSTLKKKYVTTTTSTVEISDYIEGFNIFPNPTMDCINISVDVKSGKQKGVLKIYSFDGSQVFHSQLLLNGGFNVKTLKLGLPPGMYLLQLQLQDEVFSRKISIR